MENVPAFAPLSMAESPVVAADRLSLQYGTFQIDVDMRTSPELLQRTLQILSRVQPLC